MGDLIEIRPRAQTSTPVQVTYGVWAPTGRERLENDLAVLQSRLRVMQREARLIVAEILRMHRELQALDRGPRGPQGGEAA